MEIRLSEVVKYCKRSDLRGQTPRLQKKLLGPSSLLKSTSFIAVFVEFCLFFCFLRFEYLFSLEHIPGFLLLLS